MAASRSTPRRSSRPLAIGVDVGATKLLAAAVDSRGVASHLVQARTPSAEGPAAVMRAIAEAVSVCQDASGGEVASVGVGFAGQVSGGLVRSSPNLAGWRDVPLAARLRRRLGVPVALENDARAAAWAECRFGHGRGRRDVVFVALGTGIGAGILSGGVLLQGATGCAGELGHVPVVAGGRPCTCGGRGCLEAYAGGWALAREARHAVRKHPRAGATMLGLAGSPARIDARILARASAAEDPLARAIVAEASGKLRAACVGIVNAFNPDVLVFGGGVAKGFPQLVRDVRQGVRTRSLAPARGVRVAVTRLGLAAVAVGAADLGRRAAQA